MPDSTTALFPASLPVPRPGAVRVADVDPAERVEVSVSLVPHAADAAGLPRAQADRRAALRRRREVSHAGEIRALHAFAADHGLSVTASEPVQRLVKLAGTAAQMEAAFAVRLGRYERGATRYRSHEGALSLPVDLLPIVEAVLGLDTHPAAEPLAVRTAEASLAAPPYAFLPSQIAPHYGFPTGVTGKGECIALIELGGGYMWSDTETAFREMGLSEPTLVAVSVDGAENDFFGGNAKANEEVALDIQVAGGLAHGAAIAVYFAPGTVQGFVDAVKAAVADSQNAPSAISISWGQAEAGVGPATSQYVVAMNGALKDAAAVGISVFAASGDRLATDGLSNGRANVGFPASSPWAVGCGGTQITTRGNKITGEVVWNQGTVGTGGGISDLFPVPSFQAGIGLPASVNDGQHRRGVPDVAATASGYRITVGSHPATIGGTSAVAPLWAGLAALINEGAREKVGFFLPQVYSDQRGFQEITKGDNRPAGSKIGYDAGAPWNACTGLGLPVGKTLADLLNLRQIDGTRMAAVQWKAEGQRSRRLYYQTMVDRIQETCLDGSELTVGANLTAAAPKSALTAVAWIWNGAAEIRVYYLDASNTVQEYAYVGHWAKGASLVPAAPGSALASVVWATGGQIRIYYQDASDVIQEYCLNDGWRKGATLVAAKKGSALASIVWAGGGQIRVYYQDAANVIQEYCSDDGWRKGATLPAAAPGTPLASVVWADGMQIRVYYMDGDNSIKEYCCHNGWFQGALSAEAAPGSYLYADAWTDEGGRIHLRVGFLGSYAGISGVPLEAVNEPQGWVVRPVGTPSEPSA